MTTLPQSVIPPNRVLIDADSMVYIVAWDVKELISTPENYATVIAKTDAFVDNILKACKADLYLGFLKGSQPTFRHLSNPDYKANRKTGSNEWLNKWDAVIKHRFIQMWGFTQVEGMEAEDAVSMMAHAYKKDNPFIVHIDKDLNQIPGYHYNFNKKTHYHITDAEAQRNLFMQVLTGDTTDNVPGIEGVGKVTAERILNLDTAAAFETLSLKAYITRYGEREGIIKFAENYSMVKLLDTPELGFMPTALVWNIYTPPLEESSPGVDSQDQDAHLFKQPNHE